MMRQNPILKRARISTAKFRQILKYFALDIEAIKIAQLTGLNRNTINKYLQLVRKVIALECEQDSPFSGEVEVDESFLVLAGPKVKEVAEPVVKLSYSDC